MTPKAKENFDSKIDDICRCCLKNSCSKDTYMEFGHSNLKNVFKEMLEDTFNIEISNHKSLNIRQGIICNKCIVRLKDAAEFKKMVLQTVEQFEDHVKNLMNSEQGAGMSNNSEMITEVNKSGHSLGEDLVCDDSSSEDEVLANVRKKVTKNSRSLKKRTKCEDSSSKRNKVKTELQIDVSRIIDRRGDGPIRRQNSLKLISNSTLCVFQWNQSRYRCFCCQEPFDDIDSLREHNNSHGLEDIQKKIIAQQNRLVKVEISNLFCKLCSDKIVDLEHLKSHLTSEHDVFFYSKEDLLVPFRISSDGHKCQICSEAFNGFRLLNIHMNKHYQKQVCHICGAGFSNLVFLNLHRTRSHRPLKCQNCGISFTTKADKKHHEISVHGVVYERKLRFPCPYCPERFFHENYRVLHLIDKHGLKRPDHACATCKKTFVTRSLLNNHIRSVHKKEKKHECDFCRNLFYTKSDLIRHISIHTGEKKCRCQFCKNVFATKDSLRRHVKKAHSEHQHVKPMDV